MTRCGSLVALASLLICACGTPQREGDCGSILSSAECAIVHEQLGTLPRRPPADPTNRLWDNPDAVELGRALFFDKCLSESNQTSCGTCHHGRVAFADQRRGQSSPSDGNKTFTGRNTAPLYNVAYGAGALGTDSARTGGAAWVPWDGRYDSLWALSGEVFEFGAVQRTSRAYLAQRIGQQHSALYKVLTGVDLSAIGNTVEQGKFIYPVHASPATGFRPEWRACWDPALEPDPKNACKEPSLKPLEKKIRDEINQIMANAGKALAAYMAAMRSGRSPYDRFVGYYDGDQLVPPDPQALSGAQQRGLQLFIGKAGCLLCHSGPNFTDWRFHNLGVPAADPERRTNGSAVMAPDPLQPAPACVGTAGPTVGCPDVGHFAWQNRLTNRCGQSADGKAIACQNSGTLWCGGAYNKDGTDQCLRPPLYERCDLAPGADAAKECPGRPGCQLLGTQCVPVPSQTDLGAFKTPSLRNVELTWPYMHNGTIQVRPPSGEDATPHLMAVIEFYNRGGGAPVVGTRDPRLRPLHLSSTEMADLVEFLKALTDEDVRSGADPIQAEPPGETYNKACPKWPPA